MWFKRPTVKLDFNYENVNTIKDKISSALESTGDSISFFQELTDMKSKALSDIEHVLGVGKKFVEFEMNDFDIAIKYSNSDTDDLITLCKYIKSESSPKSDSFNNLLEILEEVGVFDCDIEIRIKKGH